MVYADAMGYVPQLDSLRALAALAVLLFHSKVPGFRGGYLGVDVFFVLSGYLITSLLVLEHRRGRINLQGFYARRLRRLYPALLFFLVTYVVVASVLVPQVEHWKGAMAAGLYLLDYAALYPPANYIRHTWSLAAEMHFYLVWPLLIISVLRTSDEWRLRAVIFWIAVLGTLWAVANQSMGLDAYSRMDVRVGQMACGGWVAMMVLTEGYALSRDTRRKIALGGLIAIAYLVWLGIPNPWKIPLAGPAAALATAAFIYGADTLEVDNPAVVWLGKMSYGIYLWHFPIVLFMLRSEYGNLTAIVAFSASVTMAALSYYTVERWSRRPATTSQTDGLTAASRGL